MFPLLRRRGRAVEIEPDEILIDSSNIPAYDKEQFEGRIERPIGERALWFAGMLVLLLLFGYSARAFELMVVKGQAYAKQAAENQLAESIVFADRGVIKDRAGKELAFNERLSTTSEYATRAYAPWRGTAHVVGYTKPPLKDSSGVYYQESYVGVDGVEQVFDSLLEGHNGRVLTEVNARGELVSQSTLQRPVNGEPVVLSIDAEVSQALFDAIATRAEQSSFTAGAGILMDIYTGEIIALVSYPEFPLEGVASGSSTLLTSLSSNEKKPFLDRAVDGLYAPGSIVKPFIALAALEEGIIDEYKEIVSTGAIAIPNPYDPSNPSIYRDWRAHGAVDMRRALAVSSDVYFYEIGGGYKEQPGLGITRIEEYMRHFGFGSDAGLSGFSTNEGTLPSPEWKAENFNSDPWRLGNTYHTTIGQYGMQITPLQAVRAIAAIANGGELVVPTLLTGSLPVSSPLSFTEHSFDVVREGMRMAVTEGTAAALNLPFVEVAAKTGTAQVGVQNELMHSWAIGFFPYEKPHYAFAVVLERAPAGTLFGAPAAMNNFFLWLNEHAPEYVQGESTGGELTAW